MELKKIVAHNIKLYRSARGMSPAHLAEQSKVNRSTILRIERAEKSPTFAMLEKISIGLRILPDQLFGVPAEHALDCRKRNGGPCSCFYDEHREPFSHTQ